MPLNHFLKKENNNFDLLRLILASMVIFGHAQYLNRGSDSFYNDPLLGIYPECSSGDVAVKCFFFLSGLLISTSLKRNPSVLHYFISRTFRILPPLSFVLLIITFVFGPFLTSLNLKEYFLNSQSWSYFINGSLLNIKYELPGVFEAFEHKTVNGSLWTLPIEFKFYLLLLAFFLLVGFRKIWLVNLVLGIVLLESLFGKQLVLSAFGNLSITTLLPISFFYGVFLGVNSEKISIDLRFLVGMGLLFIIFRNQPYGELIFTFFFCTLAFYVSTLKSLFRFKPPIDVSYGVYLWGYFVQQALFYYFGTINIWIHILSALLLSVVLAIITHYLIEKPFMNYGKALFRKIKDSRRFQFLDV